MKYKNIENLIAKGEISDAIKELRELIDESNLPEREELILQSSRLNRTLINERKGITSDNVSNLVINQVTDGVLKIIKELRDFDIIFDKESKIMKKELGDTIYGDKIMGDKVKGNKITINNK